MGVRVFFDTNILIYVGGQSDPRATASKQLLGRGGVVGIQVLNEFVAVARRKLAMSWEDIADALEAIRSLCGEPTPLDWKIHAVAVDLARRHGLEIYDALIVSAALAAKCAVLYTEDMQHGRTFEGRLTLENPFVRPLKDKQP